MPTINGKACVVNGTPVDKVFSNGKQVYGRNLYTDTHNFDNPASWFSYSSWTKTTDTYNGLAVMQITQDWSGICQYIQVKKGDVLTYSVYAQNTSGIGKSTIYWTFASSATANPVSNVVTITDSWQRVSGTVVATSDGYLRPRLERSNNNTSTLQIAGIKLEKGSVATPWTPAPEDVGAVVQSAYEKSGLANSKKGEN
ncbi:phage head spike fiber domain-containing protein [Limosilactobacillus fermentum]|uniref:phage head spike fiber domain-containing protein n=1 Tax=Limosilactobacillus fermentum TaxID=1613 RepID=UPI00352A9C3B